MKKLIATMAAALMLLTVGCNFDFSLSNTSKQYMEMDSGKIMITGMFNEAMLASFLRATDEVKDYHILINSFGGSAYDLLGMLNRIEDLQSRGAHITTETHGYAMSAGSILFLSGDTRIAHTGSGFMIHAAGIDAFVGRKTIKTVDIPQHEYDLLKIVDEVFIQMLMERTTMSLEEANRWLYFEEANFLRSEKAFELNIATELKGT